MWTLLKPFAIPHMILLLYNMFTDKFECRKYLCKKLSRHDPSPAIFINKFNSTLIQVPVDVNSNWSFLWCGHNSSNYSPQFTNVVLTVWTKCWAKLIHGAECWTFHQWSLDSDGQYTLMWYRLINILNISA